ncbi:MAG: hypothetical protein ACKVGZ_12900, partial [Alphaproteobacteria bacterium]
PHKYVSNEQFRANELGVTPGEVQSLEAKAQAEVSALNDLEVRQMAADRCLGLKKGQKLAHCVTRRDIAKKIRWRRAQIAIEADPLAVCIKTKLTMGFTKPKATQMCTAFTQNCRKSYARVKGPSAGQLSFSLTKANGNAYFKCKGAAKLNLQARYL